MENQQQEAAAAESTTLPATPSSQPNDIAPKKEPRHGSSLAIRVGVLVALLMGGSALGGGYYLYQQLVEQYHYTLSVEEKQSASLKEPVSRLNQLEQRLKQIGQFETELGRLTADQSALERRLTNLSQKTPDDWLIAEADYLVRMAGRKLWLEQDPATALSLLKTADERIAAMQQPSLFSLRKALAADMEQVASVRSTDIAGNVYALDEIMKRIERLTPGRNKQEYTPPTDETISDSLNDWQTNLAKSWKALINDFVTVRQRTGDITPLLSPEQEWYLKENIRTKLLQAQLALYRHDELSFREAILMAGGWVKLYFSVDSGTGAQILERLDSLASLRIDAVPISKFQSSDMLRTLVQEGVKAPQPIPDPTPIPAVNPLPEPDQEPEPSAAAESEAEA